MLSTIEFQPQQKRHIAFWWNVMRLSAHESATEEEEKKVERKCFGIAVGYKAMTMITFGQPLTHPLPLTYTHIMHVQR